MDILLKLNNYFKSKRNVNAEHDIRGVYYNMLLLIGFTTLIIMFTFWWSFKGDRNFQLFTVFSVIAAYYISGCAIGFIFAIPKSAQGARQIPATPSLDPGEIHQPEYNDNTNLEEISDWLAKIIIGLSLTQFNYLRTMVEDAAREIANSLPCTESKVPCNNFFVFAYAIIIFYSIGGLIIGYLWTRIDFPKILSKSKRDLELIQKLKQQNKTIVGMINDPNSSVSTSDISQTEYLNDPNLLDTVKNIWNSKPVVDKTDIQKGRWGGKSIVEGYQLTSVVTVSSIPGLYKVKISVKTAQGTQFAQPVAILLHDSFKPRIRLLKAQGLKEVFVEVLAYEAFTVAALMDIKSNKEFISLELDLNLVTQLPEGFYWH